MYRCVLMIFLLFFVSGCLGGPQQCRYPDLFQPGYHHEQLDWAARFDPFTSSEIGPKIVGDRPSGALDATPSEQRRAQRNPAR